MPRRTWRWRWRSGLGPSGCGGVPAGTGPRPRRAAPKPRGANPGGGGRRGTSPSSGAAGGGRGGNAARCGAPPDARRRAMTFVLAAVLLATAAPQDTEPRVLLRLEDEWALALIQRDGAVFRRLLADRFIYTEDDRSMSRDDVLHDVVAGSDTVKAAH